MKKKIIFAAISALIIGGLLFMGGQESKAQFDFKKLVEDQLPDDVKKHVKTAEKVVDASKPWTLPEERATGRVLAAKVAKSPDFGTVWRGDKQAEAWTLYVNKIGRGLVPYSARPDIKYRFAILNSDDMNAYACPGGYIFVTKGLLKGVRNEAELAGVLGHEIGHIAKRHVEKSVKAGKWADIAIDLGSEELAKGGKVSKEQVKVFKDLSNDSYDFLAKTGLPQIDEFDADKEGTKTIVKAGYHPKGLKNFLKVLGDMSGEKEMKINLSTHPKPKNRDKKIVKLLEKKGWDKKDGYKGKERLEKMRTKYPL